MLTNEQVEILKEIGVCMIATCGDHKIPHCTIVEPTEYSNDQIIIPIVQMETSVNNMEENPNIFLHFYYINKNNPDFSTQYKINAIAKLEFSGEDFLRVKNYEETNVLPVGYYVKGIVRAEIKTIEVCVG